MRFLILFFLLISCGRGLTPTEQNLIGEITGDGLNVNAVRFVETPFIGTVTRTFAARPQTTCRERINPPPSGPTIQTRTAGAVAWTHVLTSSDWTIPNYAPNYPEVINLSAAMFFAHEMVHIWQWQNREITAYTPFRALAEHKPGVDPYLFDPQEEVTFLDIGYEQQAALVEEFICCRTIAPDAARTQRLYDTLSQAMPVQHPTQTPRPSEIYGVWEGADLNGVCD